MNTCKDCRFFVGQNGAGACHAKPPVPVVVPTRHPISGAQSIDVRGAYPPVGPGDWCGEFQQAGTPGSATPEMLNEVRRKFQERFSGPFRREMAE